jgi:dTDP-4-amino-4,6-dideoxygalactose transaminase
MSEARIPILDLRPQFAAIEHEVRAAIDRVLVSQHFILGPEVEAFEREVAAFLETKHAIGVASGSDALVLALLALDISEGDAVVTSPMTYVATAEAITRVGARPVFADVRDDDLNLDVRAVERALERSRGRVRAILPVHLYGRACDIEALCALARSHDAVVVEDAAQALGARKGGRRVGTFGEVGCYSFFPSKNLGAFGDGGLVTTSRDDLAERVRRLRVHGQKARYMHDELGLNSRLDALQAAVLRVKLPHLDAWNNARRAKVRLYREVLAGSPIRCMLEDGDGRHDIFHLCVVRVPKGSREALQARLTERGIQTIAHYPKPLHVQPCFAHLGDGEGSFPVAEAACHEVLSLPLYPEMADDVVVRVAREIREFFGV